MSIFEVLAHEGEEVVKSIQPALDEVIRSNSIKFSLIASGVILLLTVVSLIIRQKNEILKYILFIGFIVVILANSIYLVGSTLYLNRVSKTGGPIHWHADFEIYNCGKKVEIKNPEGFSNKVGTEVVHEHNDNRIHIEGVILDQHDTSIGHFIEQLGGQLHEDHMAIPAQGGLLEVNNGQICKDGQAGMLQVFVYQTHDKTFSQQKLISSPQDYTISPFGQVPPGDCIIIEYGPEKKKTDKLCNFYKIAVEKGELSER